EEDPPYYILLSMRVEAVEPVSTSVRVETSVEFADRRIESACETAWRYWAANSGFDCFLEFVKMEEDGEEPLSAMGELIFGRGGDHAATPSVVDRDERHCSNYEREEMRRWFCFYIWYQQQADSTISHSVYREHDEGGSPSSIK
ncbi:3284_t:CDS:2, partial [Acaulospora colombiana]